MPDDLDNPDSQEPSQLRAMLEEQTRQRAEAQAQLANLQRREAMRDAGLDPANKLHSTVMQAYDGDLAPDAIRAYADELGLRAPAADALPETPPQPLAQDQVDALNRIADAARDSGLPQPAPDAAARIRAEMEVAARRGDNAALDRLTVELSRAGGNMTKWDLPSAETPGIPTSSVIRQMTQGA